MTPNEAMMKLIMTLRGNGVTDTRVLKAFKDHGVRNIVFITGDVHYFAVSTLEILLLRVRDEIKMTIAAYQTLYQR